MSENDNKNPVLEAVRGLREEIGNKHEDVGRRLDEIEKASSARDADAKNLQGELEKLRAFVQEREATITEMQRRQRVQGMERDGVTDKREGLRILGAMFRKMLADHERTDVPSAFAQERDLLAEYNRRLQERATLQAGATGGSYLVPTLLESEVIDSLEEVSELVSRTNFVPGLPGNLDIPVLTGRPTLQNKRATVDTNMTQSDPTFGQLQIRPEEAYVWFPVDNRLLKMEAVMLGSMILGLLRDSAMQGIADWLINADGTSTYNSITGILNEATYVTPLTSGTAFSNLAFADLAKVASAVLKRGRSGVWVMAHDILWTYIADLNRTGKVPAITYDGQGNALILGRPVVVEEGFPGVADTAADTGFIGFGDLRAYTVGLQGGMQISVSEHYLHGRNQTSFRNVLNLDIKRAPVNTFRLLKTNEA